MNNKILPLGLFFTLLISSFVSGHHGYCKARESIIADLHQALFLTIIEKQDNIIPNDTLLAYRNLQKNNASGKILLAVADRDFCNKLQDKQLRNHAYILLDVVDKDYNKFLKNQHSLCSDTIIVTNKRLGNVIALRSYASCSFATILSMSDQRISLILGFSAILWAIFSFVYLKRKRCQAEDIVQLGGLSLIVSSGKFLNTKNQPVHLTPMQQQLMEMFFASSDHKLSKESICNALWPRKDNANDTLYTLIRRLKPTIESNSNLKITTDRGKSYSLETNKLDNCQ